jgi:hypothetical protein
VSAPLAAPTQATLDEIVERVFDSMVKTLELFCIYVGDQLGFYTALHEGGPASSTELAARVGTNERYTREWLGQQATAGFITCANPDASSRERRYALPWRSGSVVQVCSPTIWSTRVTTWSSGPEVSTSCPAPLRSNGSMVCSRSSVRVMSSGEDP